jgi:hypothetical protein
MRFSLAPIVMAFVVGLLLTSLEPANAQDAPQPSPNPAVFKAQLLEFTQLARKNLRAIQALPVDDSIPVDAGVRNSARQAYILIRAAVWGIDLARQKHEDPMLALVEPRVDEAKNLARYPVDFTGVPRAEYVSTSVQYLSRSLKLVQQALVMLP